jgi:hypothetical protein
MGFLHWMRRSGGGGQSPNERLSIRQYGPGEMAYRIERPFEHLNYIMTLAERKVVAGIEARRREQYEQVKNYPPMSEGQEWNRKVFQAVDGAYRTLEAREDGHYKHWKALELDVEKAFQEVREAFAGQRKHLEHELAKTRKYEKKLAPNHKDRGTDR